MRRLLAICLVLAACATPSLAAQPGRSAFSATAQARPNFVELVKREGATVVHISTARDGGGFEERGGPNALLEGPVSDLLQRFLAPDAMQFQRRNVGSGFLISEDGYILTNAHLVADGDQAIVRLFDRRESSRQD